MGGGMLWLAFCFGAACAVAFGWDVPLRVAMMSFGIGAAGGLAGWILVGRSS